MVRHLRESYGLPVFDFPGPKETPGRPLPEADAVAWRVSCDTYDSEESWTEAFARFAAAVDLGRVRSIVVGAWEEAYEKGPEEIIGALLAVRARLTALRALFLGDMESEECEISWIRQGDVTPLLDGFPDLEEFGVRGGSGLVFPAVTHERLRSLTVQTGGMPAEAVRGVAASDLPALDHLDLWLGTDAYGGDCSVEDVAPILDGSRLPGLRHLALRNSDIQDGIAAAVASAPVVARLETLDLSMGVLTDEGAAALLGGQPLTHLRKLDLHHNYLSEPLRQRLRSTLGGAGVVLDLDGGHADENEWDGRVWRYVAVGE
ncbi:STM4015 family protein [Streptomyces somaliensis DSM 40738]|uniref:Leucine-rich repeat domain-containing protein n=1 Tax=Streptomyces somaliensis (strain ATCC 33201 / DSM 40738 / JCM 12659 / KCTC 9044 / NCTC 11332 / NRRL B-12077 / IP 733) TaxID=1134445 RepID=A0AA44DFQ5_STRE0|nr:STM4015 family protein [Streptomyces somaliensis]MCQ0025127.1 STM4015 family protein [Streptomyces somaliensis DSM 40738]NKY15585.1 leucine-rich repeat domain-containing protein [Streptomyces somaliensis DSM 40738]